MPVDTSQYEHPAWTSALATVGGYLLVLALLFLALFVLPWLLFALL
ncbi:hypothetical protein [Natronobiforma cellulositropha]|nr:hypothetical protein [Natronobiforma cellulositropha]